MAHNAKQPWIGTPAIDLAFILAPPFVVLAAIFLFPAQFAGASEVSDAGWVLLVLLIDVAHVYSTLYRTYCDPDARRRHGRLLFAIPFLCFVGGVLAWSIGSSLFWRILAYLAVYHFVRQQYGFMRLYSRREPGPSWARRIDAVAVYGMTLYPLLWWHLKGQRRFNWFVEGDFFYFNAASWIPWLNSLYLLLVGAYVSAEMVRTFRNRQLNWPRVLLVGGTGLSWYFGIVHFNGDMAFTITNVVSHGIPYMALVWIYGQKNYVRPGKGTRFLRLLFTPRGLLLFVGILLVLAFVEEGLWDLALWREHRAVFGTTGWRIGRVPDELLAFLVPLLALPQLTHYVLDGFIWKVHREGADWRGSTAGLSPMKKGAEAPVPVNS